MASSRVQQSECLATEFGTDRLSQNSVRNYHSTLRKIPKQLRTHRRRGGSLKSRRINLTIANWTNYIDCGNPKKFVNVSVVRITPAPLFPTYFKLSSPILKD
jgi:hypothetical protein